jgi:hypothetical protein
MQCAEMLRLLSRHVLTQTLGVGELSAPEKSQSVLEADLHRLRHDNPPRAMAR